MCLRQILKMANRQGWLEHLPNLSEPYRASSKIAHRAWFSPEEYKQLYEETAKHAKKPPKPRWRWACEQLHDFVLFMANTGLRPDEALRLRFRDVELEEGERENGKDDILVIKVRGKRGVGYCKSTHGAVEPFRRLKERRRPTGVMGNLRSLTSEGGAKAEPKLPQPDDLLFPKTHRELFSEVLKKLKLKADSEGNPRTAYSLRHTYISFRLMEGANIYEIAKNCRTSVEMIEKYYASHIKDRIDAAAINVMKHRKKKPKQSAKAPAAVAPQ